MKMTIASALAVATLATGAFADTSAPTGDVEAGEKAFKKCKSCHMIQDADGENIVKGGKTGPNLYGVVGRTAGTYEGSNIDCAPDLTGEGDLNFLDVSAFLSAFANQEPIADFAPDNNFNFLDVSAFLDQFASGCP